MPRISFGMGRWSLVTLFCVVGLLYLLRPHPSHWMGFSQREARLADRLRQSEDQAQWLSRQLRLVQTAAAVKNQHPGLSSLGGGDDSGRGGSSCGEESSCQTVHVGIVCAGVNASRTVVTLLKSILFYRRNPLVFHMISDYSARRVLTLLVTTWRLPQVTFRFYKAETVISDVSWIPNKHYSGVHGLLKLTLPKILPKSVSHAIILDTDVIFTRDIGQLWKLFHSMEKTQAALGLVENQSDWYIPGKLWKNHRPWPALGRGYNTGVILMRLGRLRAINWAGLWRGVAENDLLTLLSTSLADQDIFNAVIRRQSELLFPLPCSWNLQLSDNSLSESLCLNKSGNNGGNLPDTDDQSGAVISGQSDAASTTRRREVSVVHFNSPKKFNSGLREADYFRALHQTFLQYDGNLLRRELYFCEEEQKAGHLSLGREEGERDTENTRDSDRGIMGQEDRRVGPGQEVRQEVVADENDPGDTVAVVAPAPAPAVEGPGREDETCREIYAAGRIIYRTHIYFLPYCESSSSSSNDSITLVLQMSLDRLHMLEPIARGWEGVISVALYLTDAETDRFLNFHQNSRILQSRCNIAYHVVYQENQFYPVNYLRNLALKYVDTPFVFLSDVDFLPSTSSLTLLRQHVRTLLLVTATTTSSSNKNYNNGVDNRRALVVPAFESERYNAAQGGDVEGGGGVAGSKAELIKQLDLGEILNFRSRVWPQGHAPTNYLKWRTATLPYQVRWKEDYEPYIVVPSTVARYDTRFVGFGWNKVSHIYQLHITGYKFIVLPNVFIVHTPHTPSLDIYKFRSSKTYRHCLGELKRGFMQEMETRYNSTTPPLSN